MKDLSKVKTFFRKRFQRVRDYIKYRVLVDQKQLLIIPGPAPLTQSITHSLKDTWRITTLDFSSSPADPSSLTFKDYETLYKDIQTLSIKFDAILCLRWPNPAFSIKDNSFFESYNASVQQTLFPQIISKGIKRCQVGL